MTNLIIPKEWANNFLKFQQNGDDIGLYYLDDVFEDNFNREQRLEYRNIRRLVRSLIDLNSIVIDMEYGYIRFDAVIEESYRSLIQRLIEIAENS